MDLYLKLEQLIDELNKSVESLRVTGAEYAKADGEYKIALRSELLKLEAEGRPVTNLLYIARGERNVANAKYMQICKEAVYKANLEAIQAKKLQIKIIESQINREYSNGVNMV